MVFLGGVGAERGWGLWQPLLLGPDLFVGLCRPAQRPSSLSQLNSWHRLAETHWQVSKLTWGKGMKSSSLEENLVAAWLQLDSVVALIWPLATCYILQYL